MRLRWLTQEEKRCTVITWPSRKTAIPLRLFQATCINKPLDLGDIVLDLF
jgi:hypothetical protein